MRCSARRHVGRRATASQRLHACKAGKHPTAAVTATATALPAPVPARVQSDLNQCLLTMGQGLDARLDRSSADRISALLLRNAPQPSNRQRLFRAWAEQIFFNISKHADGERRGPMSIWRYPETHLTEIFQRCPLIRSGPWHLPSACAKNVLKMNPHSGPTLLHLGHQRSRHGLTARSAQVTAVSSCSKVTWLLMASRGRQ